VSWPHAETRVDEELVRYLLRTQFPAIAEQECWHIGEGFDNFLWRVGDHLVVRLPRREAAVTPMVNEINWLNVLAQRLSLRTPAPLFAGAPSDRFAWPWLIGRWINGEPGDEIDFEADADAARAMGNFLRELHEDAPSEAPTNVWRGIPLAQRTDDFERRARDLEGEIDLNSLLDLWERACNAPTWDRAPRWLHGDFHPGNLVYQDGALVGVVDFGDLCAGDPATDLAGGLMSLPFEHLDVFFSTYGNLDEATMQRSVGWALLFGVMMVSLGLQERHSYLDVGRRALANASALSVTLR
jgi:aminoglycoside phosphotransferase (APT) family kinase protein